MSVGEVRFSVVIPAYNRCEELVHCLESLRSCAALPGGIETIVVDDHSSDATVEVVRTGYPEVRLFELARNYGPSHARNIGIREARGKYILFLDSDTRIGSIEVFLNAQRWFEEHPETGTVGGEIRAYGTDRQEVFGRTVCPNGDSGPVAVPLRSGAFRPCDFLPTCACFVPTELARRVGGFDPYYGFGGEDKDFGYRIQRTGYTNYLSADCAILHYHSPRGRKTDETYRYQKTRMRFVLKHAGRTQATRAVLFWLSVALGFYAFLPVKIVLLASRRTPFVKDHFLGGWFMLKSLFENLRGLEELTSSRTKNFLEDLEVKKFVENSFGP